MQKQTRNKIITTIESNIHFIAVVAADPEIEAGAEVMTDGTKDRHPMKREAHLLIAKIKMWIYNYSNLSVQGIKICSRLSTNENRKRKDNRYNVNNRHRSMGRFCLRLNKWESKNRKLIDELISLTVGIIASVSNELHINFNGLRFSLNNYLFNLIVSETIVKYFLSFFV